MLLSQLLPEVSVDDWLGHLPSSLPPVATVGLLREFQVQGGVDREPPMIIHSSPCGGSVARGGMLGEQVQLSPGHSEFFCTPFRFCSTTGLI